MNKLDRSIALADELRYELLRVQHFVDASLINDVFDRLKAANEIQANAESTRKPVDVSRVFQKTSIPTLGLAKS